MSILHLLILVTTLLALASAGLLIVRMSAAQYAAIGWVSAAFAAGAAATTLMLLDLTTLGGVLPDLMLLLAFVLLHVAVRALSESGPGIPRLGVVLLFLEILTGIFLSKGLGFSHLRTEALGFLVAAQAAETALEVCTGGRCGGRVAAWFVAVDLIFFMMFNLVRSLLLVVGGLPDPTGVTTNEEVAFAVYLLVPLGFALGFFWLMTEQQANKLENMAGTDPLTRAANRRNFLVWCEQERERSQRSNESFSILMVDIDHFKNINDTFGHAVGDSVICDVVDKVRDAIRGIDIVGRWGGEEFVVLLRHSTVDSARIVAERIRSGVENLDPSASPMRYGSRGVTVSVGMASYCRNEPVADLIARADSALYEAKTAGRNRVRTSPADVNLPTPELIESDPLPQGCAVS